MACSVIPERLLVKLVIFLFAVCRSLQPTQAGISQHHTDISVKDPITLTTNNYELTHINSTMQLSSIVALLAISSTSAFAPAPSTKASTSLNAENKFSKFVTASLASAIILSSVAAVPDAFAADTNMNFGTSDIIAARSGGRGGGRSSGGGGGARRAPTQSYRPAPTTINRTTIMAAPTPMYSAPIVIGSPFSPFGMGGYGAFGAVNAISNEMRDNRQEGEIQRGRTELEISKQRQAQLEQRLNDMERNQAITNANVNSAISR